MNNLTEKIKSFLDAIESNDANIIRSLVGESPELLGEAWSGRELHLAARKGKIGACEALIELGVDINKVDLDSGSDTPIDSAVSSGSIEAVKWFLHNGATVDGAPTSVCTPLMSAAIDGHVAISSILLDAGAEINREHLRMPQTALDYAIFYQVKNTGQDAVAALLRERGGIRPYTEKHDWNDVPGQFYIEHIERAVGGFANPIPAREIVLKDGSSVAIRKVRIPKKYDYQLLFTTGLGVTGFELALCLPSAWPLNQSSLKEPRFSWPLDFLCKISDAFADNLSLSHGELLGSDHPALEGVDVPESMKQWVVSLNQEIETEHEGDFSIARTLLLTPVTTKKPVKSGAEALALADKRQQAKWKALALGL